MGYRNGRPSMNEWAQRVREHRVWTEIEWLKTALNDVDTRVEVDEYAMFGMERLRSVLAFVQARLAFADAGLIPLSTLDKLGGAFSNTRANLESFANSRNVGDLQRANSAADEVIVAASDIGIPLGAAELSAFAERAREYTTALDEGLAGVKRGIHLAGPRLLELESRVTELVRSVETIESRSAEALANQEAAVQSQLAELKRWADSQANRLEQTLAEHQRQHSEAQERRSLELLETIRSTQQQLAQVTSEQQGQFSQAQEARNRDFNEAQSSRQGKYEDVLSEFAKRLSEQNESFSAERLNLTRKWEANINQLDYEYCREARGILEVITNHKRDVEKLVGVIGALGVASGYQKTANHARRATWIWQGVTVVAILGLIGLAWATLPLVEDKSGTVHWGVFAGRVLLTLACGVLAAYAGSQADKQFTLEARNRRLALEFEAMEPYVAPLPQTEQDKFRILFGERSFGRPDAGDLSGTGKSPATVLDLLATKEGRQIIDLLLTFAKTSKPAS